MDENDQPQPPRIQHNPYLDRCPDFGDGSYDLIIQRLIEPDRTREQVIDDLKDAWRTQNVQKKALWDAQLLADQERQNQPHGRVAPADEPPEDNEPAILRRKPKLGTFAATTSIGDEIALKPSTFAINKIKEMKYIELYCFSPAGCRDHASQKPSTADEAFGFSYGISPDGSTSSALTLKPVSALAHPGKIIPDENLTWEQVRDAKACFIEHIARAQWDHAHINALVNFFVNLDNHPYNDSPEGKQALVWYQAHAREDWHKKLGTTESYNLSILNQRLLSTFKKKACDASLLNNVTQVRSLPPPHPVTRNSPPRPFIHPHLFTGEHRTHCIMHLFHPHLAHHARQRVSHAATCTHSAHTTWLRSFGHHPRTTCSFATRIPHTHAYLLSPYLGDPQTSCTKE